MSQVNHQRLLNGLWQDYERRYPASKVADERARRVLVDGASHGARLFKPYPFRITAANGAYVTDLDGNRILDFWQGHYANILGHNPAVIREALIGQLQGGYGLQTGIPEEAEAEYAVTFAQAIGAERIRLTTAGTLATMYALMLARAFTQRKIVLKLAGGWHGSNPLALKGVGRTASGYDHVDSAGVPRATEEEILVTRFNDVEGLERVFRAYGSQIACFIFEPCPGSGGFIPATVAFMNAARRLTEQYGALLILDEVITGFRYCASGVQRFYGVRPDLSTFGKVVGGGMPLSLVAGRAEIMDLAGENVPERVWFNGGTFSAHSLTLLAGQTMINYLIEHEREVYSTLAVRGERLRRGVEKVFADRGILARCTGDGNEAIPGSSLSSIYFPLREDVHPSSMDELTDPSLCDGVLREQGMKLGLLLHGVNVAHGLGAVSYSHTDQDLERVFEACDAFALRLKAAR